MANQPENFISLLYTLTAIYWIAGIGLYVFFIFLKKKVPRWWIAFFIIVCVIVDLVLFSRMILPEVSMARETISFNQKSQPFSFPQQRMQRLYFFDFFRYFRPAIEQKFVAFDSTILAFFNRKEIIARLDEMCDQILDGEFPLSNEVTEFNAIDFVQLGKTEYEQWNNRQRFAYINVLEIIVESFLAYSDFYLSFRDALPMMQRIKGDLGEGYLAVLHRREWTSKDQAVTILEKLLQLEATSNPEMNARKFLAISQYVSCDAMVRQHRFFFKQLKTADFLTRLLTSFQLHNVNSFVRFKDFDRVIDFFQVDAFEQKTPASRKRIKKDLGLSEPMLQFYPCNRATNASYVEALEKGTIDAKALYLSIAQVPSCASGSLGGIGLENFRYNVESFQPNRLQLSVYAPVNGFLYWSDGYDPYWQVRVDGKPMPIIRANNAFKAVPLEGGQTHQVEFNYNPLPYRISLWAYYLVGSGCIIFLIIGALRRQNTQRIKT